MSAYNFLHLSAMWGCYVLVLVLAAALVACGVVHLWHQVRGAPEGHEDRSGFHQDNGGAL